MPALRIFLTISIIFCSGCFVSGQAIPEELTFSFKKADIEKIFYNDNKPLKLDFFISGFSDKEEAKVFKKNKTLPKIKTGKFNPDNTTASAVFPQNIDGFRILLEKNNVAYFFCDNIKIKTSNLITQDKALELSQSIIDVPAIRFDASYNKADNLGHFEFNVYYYETKLNSAMHNYYASLLKGSIEKLQESLKNAKEEKEEFIQQHSK